jgi:hypothetical protein
MFKMVHIFEQFYVECLHVSQSSLATKDVTSSGAPTNKDSVPTNRGSSLILIDYDDHTIINSDRFQLHPIAFWPQPDFFQTLESGHIFQCRCRKFSTSPRDSTTSYQYAASPLFMV